MRLFILSILPNPVNTRAQLLHLDILLEALYPHLECLLKNNASVSSCYRAPWTS
jgi:hypothetical protein